MASDEARAAEVTLAIETAFPTISVALRVGSEIFEPRTDLGAARASGLHPAVADVLAQSGRTAQDLQHLIVDVGPGSYTGLRVGIAMARSFVELLELSVSAVFSFDLLARRACANRANEGPASETPDEISEDIYVAADARRGQWFVARYRRSGTRCERVDEPTCIPAADFADLVPAQARVVTATGRAPSGETMEVGTPTAREIFDAEDLAWREDVPSPRYLMPALPPRST